MKEKIKKYIKPLCLALLVLLAGRVVLRQAAFMAPLPENTKVALVFATLNKHDPLPFDHRTQLRLYDENGRTLRAAQCYQQEMLEHFALPHPGGLTLFFEDRTILMGREGTVSLRAPGQGRPNDATRSKDAPRAAGRIDGLGLSYAQWPGFVRFVSDDGTAYEVDAPGINYFDTLCYDSARRQLVGLLSGDGPVRYVTFSYNEATGRFEFDSRVHTLDDPVISHRVDASQGAGLVRDGRLYYLTTLPHQEGDLYGDGALLLLTYDLDRDKFLSCETVLEHHPLGLYGGVMTAWGDPPTVVKDERLFYFLSTDQVCILSPDGATELVPMPFPFQNVLSVSSLYGGYLPARPGYQDILIEVGADGTVCAAVPAVGRRVTIYRLLPEGEWTPIWSARLPLIAPDMILTGFVFVT